MEEFSEEVWIGMDVIKDDGSCGLNGPGGSSGLRDLRRVRKGIEAVTREVCAMLLEKNAAYGNSALDPVRIFSKSDPIEQINVRLDDKLSRIVRGEAAGEDVELDLIGYLVLKRVANRLGSECYLL